MAIRLDLASVGPESSSLSETLLSHTASQASVLQQMAASSAPAGESACALIQDGRTALLARLALAKHASHTLDVQYYLWHDDETGRLLARGLLEAADRGVRALFGGVVGVGCGCRRCGGCRRGW